MILIGILNLVGKLLFLKFFFLYLICIDFIHAAFSLFCPETLAGSGTGSRADIRESVQKAFGQPGIYQRV